MQSVTVRECNLSTKGSQINQIWRVSKSNIEWLDELNTAMCVSLSYSCKTFNFSINAKQSQSLYKSKPVENNYKYVIRLTKGKPIQTQNNCEKIKGLQLNDRVQFSSCVANTISIYISVLMNSINTSNVQDILPVWKMSKPKESLYTLWLFFSMFVTCVGTSRMVAELLVLYLWPD